MNLLILPGNSIHNKEWAYNLAEYFKGSFEKTFVFEYDHWQSGAPVIDFDLEQERLGQYVFENDLGNYVLCGKSAGTLLGMLSTNAKVLNPMKSILLGVPVRFGGRPRFICRRHSSRL